MNKEKANEKANLRPEEFTFKTDKQSDVRDVTRKSRQSQFKFESTLKKQNDRS
jgi:hypothetical protein